MMAGIAAHRAGRSPNVLQVFEVGTATMMYSKGAIVPVGDIMEKAGYKLTRRATFPPFSGTTPRPTAAC